LTAENLFLGSGDMYGNPKAHTVSLVEFINRPWFSGI
jgi:hypothetical protein